MKFNYNIIKTAAHSALLNMCDMWDMSGKELNEKCVYYGLGWHACDDEDTLRMSLSHSGCEAVQRFSMNLAPCVGAQKVCRILRLYNLAMYFI